MQDEKTLSIWLVLKTILDLEISVNWGFEISVNWGLHSCAHCEPLRKLRGSLQSKDKMHPILILLDFRTTCESLYHFAGFSSSRYSFYIWRTWIKPVDHSRRQCIQNKHSRRQCLTDPMRSLVRPDNAQSSTPIEYNWQWWSLPSRSGCRKMSLPGPEVPISKWVSNFEETGPGQCFCPDRRSRTRPDVFWPPGLVFFFLAYVLIWATNSNCLIFIFYAVGELYNSLLAEKMLGYRHGSPPACNRARYNDVRVLVGGNRTLLGLDQTDQRIFTVFLIREQYTLGNP